MHLIYLILGLPMVLAYGSAKTSRPGNSGGLVKRDHKKDSKLARNQGHLCNTNTVYTFPYCKKDSDCQRHGSKLSNLPPSGIRVIDADFKFGDGYCHHSPKLHMNTCAAQVKADDDLFAYCKSLDDVWETKVKGLRFLNACIDPHDKDIVYCDYLCDPTVNPLCNQKHTFHFPCANLTTGGEAGGPKAWGCPNTKLPVGAHYPGEKKNSKNGGKKNGHPPNKH